MSDVTAAGPQPAGAGTFSLSNIGTMLRLSLNLA